MNNGYIRSHSVGGVIKNNNEEILIQYHNKYDSWTIPMGKAEGGLDIVQALKKELKEELDIDMIECRELTSKEFIYHNIDPKTWNFAESGITWNTVFHVFEVMIWEGTIVNNEPQKHREIKFVTLEELKALDKKSDMLMTYMEYLEY